LYLDFVYMYYFLKNHS